MSVMTDKTTIGGDAAPPFTNVLAAFEQNFADDLELGAAFAAFVDGECVVDLRGGWTDRARTEPWREETLVCVYSSGKAALARLIAEAVSAGRLDYEARVADYWPAFAANGKEKITVAEALSHQAGLSGIPEEMPPETWLDWEAMTARLAAMAPLFPPGSASGYHPQTFGFIAGELLRRANGESVGETLAAMRAREGLNLFCGMGERDIPRAAYMPKPPAAPDLGPITELKRIAFLKPWSAPAKVSREAWMAAELPASNMHADARSLAAVVHPLANDGADVSGAQVVDTSAIEAALKERIRGDDLVLPFELSWSAGLMRNINGHFGPSATAFGHAGFGGSTVMIDPERRLSCAYVMSRMSPHLVGDPRGLALIEAVYAGLRAA